MRLTSDNFDPDLVEEDPELGVVLDILVSGGVAPERGGVQPRLERSEL